MIKGITHDEQGNLHKVTKYKGKISTGYAPGEGPNKTNAPQAAGFFRVLKEQTTSKRVGASQKLVSSKDWVLNEPVQSKLEASIPSCLGAPRRIEIISLFRDVKDMWESSLSMYNNDGLVCRSNGRGTNAKYLQIDSNGKRDWIDREFNGVKGCALEDCPDKRAGKCSPNGLLKCFPSLDMSTNPYRFETKSINTIIGIESSLDSLETLLKAAHAVKQMEAGENLPYDGFFGARLYLVHRKIKSGGRDVYITDLLPSNEFTEMVMAPIKRGLEKKRSDARLVGSQGNVSMLEKASQVMLDSPSLIDDAEVVSNESEITTNIQDSEEEVPNPEVVSQDDFGKEPKATPANIAEALLGDEGKKE